MDRRPRNDNSIRNEEVKNKFKKLLEIIEKLIELLIGVVALKPTKILDGFFAQHPIVATVTVLMISLFFVVWILGTMLQHRAEEWITMFFFVCLILVIGSISSVSALATLYPLIACFSALLWVLIFGVAAFYYFQNLHQLFFCSVSDAIKKLFEFHKRQTTRAPL